MLIRHNPEAQWVLFGGGNFQLAFTGWLLDQLADGTQRQRCILVRPTDGGIYEDLEKARGKYRCLLRGMKTGQPHQSVHQLDRIDRIVYPWEDFADYLDSALLPNLRFVVSNTTEAGLQVEQEPYRPQHPARTFPGKLTQWLYHRFQHFQGSSDAGVCLLPLELVEDNGPLLKSQLLHYISIWELGDAFTDWVVNYCPAYSTLVDRIVTGKCFAPSVEEPLKTICAEPYFLWAIESDAPLFDASVDLVRFTASLQPIRNAKVRLLNATHTAMVAMGLPRDYRTVREILTSDEWGAWFRELIGQELYPSLAERDQPGRDYVRDMLDRLANPFIDHQLKAISLNSLAKTRTRIWPAIVDYHQKMGALPPRLLQVFQSMVAYYQNPSSALRDDPGAIAALREHTPDTPASILKLLADSRVWGKPLPVPAGMFPG